MSTSSPSFVGVGGPEAVFGMDAADMGTKDVDRLDRIGLAVKKQVGGVEADAEVGHGHVVDGAQHGGRCLLARLHQEVLAVALAVLGDGADGFDGLRVERIGRILGNKAAMGLHLGMPTCLAKSETWRRASMRAARVLGGTGRWWKGPA
jgi:hypothetical protein